MEYIRKYIIWLSMEHYDDETNRQQKRAKKEDKRNKREGLLFLDVV